MIRNYLKVALRALFRNKLTSFINIAGLALAMTCCLLIFLFIQDELAYDRYHVKANRIYRVTREFLSPDGSTTLHLGHVSPPFGPLLKYDFPDFEQVVRTRQNRYLVSYQENAEEKKVFNVDNCFYAEPEIFQLFDIPLVAGNKDKALTQPFTMLLSETTAKKFFGSDNVQGKRLKLNDKFDFEVGGVFKDFPRQSHLYPEMLLAFSTLNDTTLYGRKGLEKNWGNNSFATYVLVKDQPFDQRKVEAQFPAFLDKHMGSNSQKNEPKPSSWTRLYLQKLTDIHLKSQLDSEIETNGNINNVYMMGVIGLFIILIACFNFVNLSTARATKRSKEVGLRKVVGAFRGQLINQYLSESVLIAFFALLVSVCLSFIAMGWLNDFTGKSLEINLTHWRLIIGLIGFTFLVGLLAGIYPAIFVSGFKPAIVLKGQLGSTKGKGAIRKTLVVAQFAISIALMIATAITFQQLEFMNNRDLGYSRDQLVALPIFRELTPAYDAFYNELIKHSAIKNAGRSDLIPTDRLVDYDDCKVQQGDSMATTSVVIKNVQADYDFFETYQVPFVVGRNFSKAIKTDDSLAYILNEAAVKMIGWPMDKAVGKDFQYGDNKGKVIGVVKDFHFESLHEPIVPVVFFPSKSYGRLTVKVASQNMQQGIAHIEKVWKEFLPNRPFEYEFLSARYKQLYESEMKQGQLFTIFSGLAILIACLGLFGLATFNTLQRVKEIGIRKAMGASMSHILTLLSKEIVILVLIANLIAWPAAWYLMGKWLDGFAYKIDLPVTIFFLSTIAALLIALITVSSQTIKTAMTNPAKTLRYE